MAAEYRLPDNTETALYIDSDRLSMSFGRLFEEIIQHFGDECTLDQFDITIERIKITGFGCSCCYDSSDYCNYLVITKCEPGKESDDIQPMKLSALADSD